MRIMHTRKISNLTDAAVSMSQHSDVQVFAAAALLEYAGDGNDRVARNIFEVGLEQFISVPRFVLQYAEFLIGLADIHNARALFERALGETPVAESKPIWDRFLQVRTQDYHACLHEKLAGSL